jgi:23S rRNA pseudouridine2605 synthase
MEGKNREVRRLWESQNVQVSRLKRVRFGCVFLPSRLKAGFWEEMTSSDARDLYELVGLKPKRVKKKTPKEVKEKERRMAKRGNAYSEKKVSAHKKKVRSH